MKQTFSNGVYCGESKQTAAAGKTFYITAIVGQVITQNTNASLVTISFDNLPDLQWKDSITMAFTYPIMTKDFTPSSDTISIIYYEGK